jgi:hypothetical protein
MRASVRRDAYFVTIPALIFLLIAQTSGFAADWDNQGHLRLWMEADVDDARFRATVIEEPTAGPGLPSRQLEITCLEGCSTKLSYRETVGDRPISIFRLWDDSDKFITLWTAGSAYVIRIYAATSREIRKVLEEPTKSWPEFLVDAQGEPIVILRNSDLENYVPRDYQLRGVVWMWNGEKYEVSPSFR